MSPEIFWEVTKLQRCESISDSGGAYFMPGDGAGTEPTKAGGMQRQTRIRKECSFGSLKASTVKTFKIRKVLNNKSAVL